MVRSRRAATLRRIEFGLWSVAVVAASYVALVTLDRNHHQRRMAERLGTTERASATAPIPIATMPAAPAPPLTRRPPPRRGEPIGRLEIPAAGVSEIVAAGADARTLRRGVGHIDGTALPGEAGNVALAGHRDTVFRGLRRIRPGDRIFVTTGEGSFEYAVESLQTVAPERSDVLDPSLHPTLTLVTCYPFDYVGPAPLRFVVRAREIGRSPPPRATGP
jgi:sortase A